MYAEGVSGAELPKYFDHLILRKLLWKEYGITLPDFSGDDCADAMSLATLEGKRAEHDRMKQQLKDKYNGR